MGHLWSSPSATVQIQEGRPRHEKFIETASTWLGMEEKDEWLKDMRGNLAMVATVIATIAFQVGLSPPGGVVQNEKHGYCECVTEPKENYACPGESVYGAADKKGYFYFMLSNNISFFSSLMVCLWLISGLPIYRRIPTWLLSGAMCISLTTLGITYLLGAYMVTPDNDSTKTFKLQDHSITVWFIVVGIVAFLLVMRFVLLFVAISTSRTTINASPTPSDQTQVNRST